jgi:carbamoyltransferase
MSRIVGYHSGTHDASIVIIDDGEIVIAVEEERFTRIKSGDNQPSFPFLCKDKIQEKIGFNILDADWICTARPISLKFIKEVGLPDKGVKTFDHHECHAKAAYLTSGFVGKAITFTFDGGGDGTYGSIWLCEDGQMQLVKNLHIGECASLGQIWANSCHPYGWKPVKDEGKIMGMSGNGVYDENLYRIISSVIKYGGKGSLNFLPAGNNPLIWSMVRGLEKQGVFQSDEGRKNYAYALQKVTEEVMVEFVKDLISIFPEHSKQMCFGGGIFANVKMNQKINEIPSIEEIYVLPPMGDESISLGSAISMAYELGEWPAPKRIDSLFWCWPFS